MASLRFSSAGSCLSESSAASHGVTIKHTYGIILGTSIATANGESDVASIGTCISDSIGSAVGRSTNASLSAMYGTSSCVGISEYDYNPVFVLRKPKVESLSKNWAVTTRLKVNNTR